MTRILLIILSIIFCISCNRTKQNSIDFYYWRSNYQISNSEKEILKKLNVEKLYIRFFDVDKTKNAPLPIGKIQNFDATKLAVDYIPTVFITNRTFYNLSENQIKDLAQNINRLLNETANASQLKSYNEIQFDCDWTKQTKQQYFLFLDEIKKISGKNISATLRLHQVKYKDQEGVPPLEKMVLMCYATENPKEVESRNSILDLDLAKDYLKDLEHYPIQLDVALPIYSWAIVTNHLGNIKLINSFTPDQLDNKPVENLGNGIYIVKEDFFLENFYLSKGFKIKVETISPVLLKETKSYINSKLDYDPHIIYYHLDQKFIKNYNLTEL